MTNVDFGRRIVRYFWDPEPTNDAASQSPIWCLGKEYQVPKKRAMPATEPTPSLDESSSFVEISSGTQVVTPPDSTGSSVDSVTNNYDDAGSDAHEGGWPVTFLDDFDARFWLTYRSNFPAIPKSQDPKALTAMSLSVRLRSQLVDQAGFTSDTGWGCMIRSGQSLLANTISIVELGRDWRRRSSPNETRIISLFADDPRAPYSIHRFVEHGAAACGKHPGEWFGPSATARCIQALTNGSKNSSIRTYITGDGPDVYEDTFLSIAKADGKNFKPTLILVGTRLGLDKITPVYWEALKSSLEMSQSIGIAGGRPSSSHYFVGVQGDYFFYLDPHQTRQALPFRENLGEYTLEEIDSCHTRRLRRIHVKDMDPSMLLAFLIHDEADWKNWRQAALDLQGKAIIHVADTDPAVHGVGTEREGAIDEVETFDDDDEEGILGV